MKSSPQYTRCPICRTRLNTKNVNNHRNKMHSDSPTGLFSQIVNIVAPQKKPQQSKPITSYQEYLNSPEWKLRAKQARNRAGNKCQVCNRSIKEVILDVHHRTYERLGHEKDMDLTVLCRDCHTLFESTSKHRPARH